MAGEEYPKMYLSKSRFMAGLQCLKRLYFEVHEPELAAEPDEGSLAIMEQGHEVGRVAQKMFPGGLLIEAGHEELDRALELTDQAVAGNQHPAIFEATFAHDNILVRTDILERRSKGKWRLIEVKSSVKAKEHYVYDVAIQQLVLEGCGIEVVPCLMHLNREYVYDGKEYDLEKLFHIEDLAGQTAALRKDVWELIRVQRRMLAETAPPEIEPGGQCTDPVTCEFYDVCNKPLPQDHIQNLPGLSASKFDKLKILGISLIGGIPHSFSLSDRQKRVFECVRSGKPWFGKELKATLASVEHPVYFMDFETLAPALPRFTGMGPYDQVPFQWSVDVRPRPGADIEHHEFLADNCDDPRPAFIKSLCKALGKKGTVVVYNKAFESQRLADLARWIPKYADAVGNIRNRLWDLLAVVRTHVYHPAFAGSYSLKSVLPALVPEMSYEGMEVSQGSEAGLAWEKMIRGQIDAAERDRLRAALLAYCQQDTLAMVRLVDVLQRA